MCRLLPIFLSLSRTLSISTNSLVPCEFEIERVNCIENISLSTNGYSNLKINVQLIKDICVTCDRFVNRNPFHLRNYKTQKVNTISNLNKQNSMNNPFCTYIILHLYITIFLQNTDQIQIDFLHIFQKYRPTLFLSHQWIKIQTLFRVGAGISKRVFFWKSFVLISRKQTDILTYSMNKKIALVRS